MSDYIDRLVTKLVTVKLKEHIFVGIRTCVVRTQFLPLQDLQRKAGKPQAAPRFGRAAYAPRKVLLRLTDSLKHAAEACKVSLMSIGTTDNLFFFYLCS